MDALWIVVAVWLVGLLFQTGDFLAARFDARAAGDRVATGRALPPRLHRRFWLFPVAALLLGGVAVGGSSASTLLAGGEILPGLVLVLAVLVAGSAVALVSITAATRRHKPGYASLRFRLLANAGARLTPLRIARFRSEFAEIDARASSIEIGPRGSTRALRMRRELEQLAVALTADDPKRVDVVRAIRWTSANSYLWRFSPWRFAAVVLGLAVAVNAALALAATGESWLIVLIALPVPVGYLLSVVASRYFLASKATWHAVHLAQRAEVLRLVEEFERSARKGVAGLGDRVTRALQILREQQQLG